MQSIKLKVKCWLRPIYEKVYLYPAKEGRYGRYIQARVIARCWNVKFLCHKSLIDKGQYQNCLDLVNRFEHVVIRRLWSARIGEYIARYMQGQQEACENREVLYVYFLNDYKNNNKRLTTVMARECENNVCIVEEEECPIWIQLFLKSGKIDFDDRFIYCNRDAVNLVDIEFSRRHLQLIQEERDEGCYKSQIMHLQTPYVCVSNRDSAYLMSIQGSDNPNRNASSQTAYKAYEYLVEKGIACVRMGRVVSDRLELEGCIDYANDYYDELMDLYLAENCKFFVTQPSGVVQYAQSVGIPLVLTNDIDGLCGGYGGLPQNENSIIIFKHFYKKAEDRYLSIKEMMDVLYKYKDSGRSLYKEGIELIENTSDEICEAVKEMNERLDGVWTETSEDRELQDCYIKIVDQWHVEHGTTRHNAYRGRVAAYYLRNNKYLLM